MSVPHAKYLNQVLAIESGVRRNLEKTKTRLYRVSSQSELYEGHVVKYSPKQDGGDPLPPRRQGVQQRATDLLAELQKSLVPIFDVVCTKDVINCQATTDVELGGKKLLEGVPVPYLLFMEKQMDDLQKFVETIPTLDRSVEWAYNPDRCLHVSESVRADNIRKERGTFTKFKGNDNHPPQVEMVEDERLVGFWDTTRFSGALTEHRKQQIISRVMDFKYAVKFAREQANQTPVVNQKVGEKILSHLFAD